VTSAEQWVARFAERLSVEVPDAEAVDVLLEMTGIAAHSSERTAGPISTWLVGRAGVPPREALEHARALAAEMASEEAEAAAAADPGSEAGPQV